MSNALRVLIVYDGAADRTLVQTLLARSSLDICEVRYADGLGTATRMVRESRYDVILVSLADNPVADVVSVVQTQAPDAGVILLTSTEDEETASVAIRSGAQDCLVSGRLDPYFLSHAVRCALERKRMEQAIRASEARFRTIVEHSTNIFYAHAPDHTFTYASPQVKEILGYEPDEFGMRWTDIITDNPVNVRAVRLTEEAIKTGQPQPPYEVEVIARDGQKKWLAIHEAPVVVDGRTISIVGAAADITARKQVEELLHEESSFRNTIITNAIVLTDLEGRVTCTNPSCLRMWGLEHEYEALGKPFLSLLHSEQDISAVCRSIRDTGAWYGELTARKRDGSEFVVQISASLVRDKQGRPLCLMASLVDVTESRWLHDILDRKQKNLEAIFDAAPLGMLLVNEQRRVSRANDTIRRISGKGYREMLNQHPCQALACACSSHELQAGDRGAACETCSLQKLVEAVFESGSPVRGAETRPALSRNGEDVQPWFSVNLEPVNIDGEKHVLIALHNITERKEAEEKLREMMEMKSQFVSTVSHELRTPLTAMREALTIIGDGIAGKLNKDQAHFVDIARRNTERLGRLIDGVLDFQKLSANKMQFHMQSNHIDRTIDEACGTMQLQIQQRQLHLSVDVESDLPSVVYDHDRMIQVLTNLLSNAIKFTPEGGRIVLSARRQGECLALRVSDTGLGIPKEALPRIFTQFYRVHRPGREIKGTGLGLAIVNKIVLGHGGRIDVESEVDKGTTFTVLLLPAPPQCAGDMSPQADVPLESSLMGHIQT